MLKAMNISEVGSLANITDFACPFKDTNVTRTLKIFAIFFVGGFGILNNVFIIVLAIKYTTTKNLHHLIINMAVSDIITVLAMSGLKLPSMFDLSIWADVKMNYGDVICKLLSFFVISSMFVCFTTLGIISIERFRASRRTAQISQPYTLKKRLFVIACSWLISGSFAVHETPFKAIEERFKSVYACKGSFKIPVSLTIFLYAIILVSFCCIIILSAITLRRLSHRQDIEASLSEGQRKARAKRISGAIKMVLSSLLLYSICYLPVVNWRLIKRFAYRSIDINLIHCYDIYIFDFLYAFLPLMNSCFGPCTYLIFLSDFREAVKKLIGRCRTCQNIVEPQSNI